MQHGVSGSENGADRQARGSRRLLAMLLVVYALNFMDRQLVASLGEAIKRELALSDAELGLLYGFAFALVFCIAGVPLARLADRTRRAPVIAWCLAGFSAMTAACGLASSYVQLVLARIGVGIGEGGTSPASQALIAERFPEAKRGLAMAVFALGPHVGIVLGFVVAGGIGQRFGWRAAFLTAGVAGLVVAALVPFAIREPPQASAKTVVPPRSRDTMKLLWSNGALRHAFAAGAVTTALASVALGWLPSFLIRSHGLDIREAGIVLGALVGVVGAAGTFAGGWLADRLGRSRASNRLRVVCAALAIAAVGWVFALRVEGTMAAVAALVVPCALLGFHLGPTFAIVQSLVPPTIRALAAAYLILVANLFGLGLGPLAVGILSDALQPRYGGEALRHALFAMPLLAAWAAWHYHRAAAVLDDDPATRPLLRGGDA
jgi:predicted MFS family arabinose efflux permease